MPHSLCPRNRSALNRSTLLVAAVVLAVALALAGLPLPLPATATTVAPPLSTRARFYSPTPSAAARNQERDLRHSGRARDAVLIQGMSATPQAVWLTGGTAASVQRTVGQVSRAALQRATVATFVLYNAPGRDCSQYSAGGAASDTTYRAWVDGVAAGLAGRHRVIVVVEPDGVSLLPSDCPWSYPGRDAEALTAGRLADLRYAGRRLRAANPAALVYLDAGHSGWRPVGDVARRLDQAGVRDVQGFALNVANYQPTPDLLHYGSWVSRCLRFAADPTEGGWRLRHYEHCASQNAPANPDDYRTWHLTDQWYADHVDHAPDPPSTSELAHFVLDTSRNGRGPWVPPAGYLDPQTWCNPPGRGLGPQPTARTDSPLADAYLWIKTPGQSDGRCNRGIRGSGTDPAWAGRVDPAAGDWFRTQALELARLANPALH